MPFLAFEGLDGSGKSTLIQGLKSEFEKRGLTTLVTREPGGTKLGDEIRTLLLRTDGEAPVPRAEALLYQAGRAQHVEKTIRPALEKKTWVLCDRFAASSLAFQAGARAIGHAEIDWLNKFSTAGLEPDLYLLLDLTVDESFKRMEKRGAEADRFEREAKDFHEKVRAAYLALARAKPDGWLVLNAADSPEILIQTAIEKLRAKKWLA